MIRRQQRGNRPGHRHTCCKKRGKRTWKRAEGKYNSVVKGLPALAEEETFFKDRKRGIDSKKEGRREKKTGEKGN